MTTTQIQREWTLFHSVIPAASGDAQRNRTAYFYRKMAVEFARDARDRSVDAWAPNHRATCRRVAKHYLRVYRAMKPSQQH